MRGRRIERRDGTIWRAERIGSLVDGMVFTGPHGQPVFMSLSTASSVGAEASNDPMTDDRF